MVAALANIIFIEHKVLVVEVKASSERRVGAGNLPSGEQAPLFDQSAPREIPCRRAGSNHAS